MSLYLHVVVFFQHISVAGCSQSMLKHSFWTHVGKFTDYILRQELAHIVRLYLQSFGQNLHLFLVNSSASYGEFGSPRCFAYFGSNINEDRFSFVVELALMKSNKNFGLFVKSHPFVYEIFEFFLPFHGFQVAAEAYGDGSDDCGFSTAIGTWNSFTIL